MESPYFGWTVPTLEQEELIYGSDVPGLTYQERMDLEEEKQLLRSEY